MALKLNLPQYIACSFMSAVMCGFLFGYNLSVLNVPQNYITCFIQSSTNQSETVKVGDETKTWHDICKNASDPANQVLFEDSSSLFSLITSIYTIGGMIGALSGGSVYKIIKSRRYTIILILSLHVIFSLLEFFTKTADSWVVLFVSRIFLGMASGLASTIAPAYLNEVADSDSAGIFGISFNLSVVTGIMMAQLFGLHYFLVGKSWGNFISNFLFTI